jgi:polar amino acid transport system substrate-binding protein
MYTEHYPPYNMKNANGKLQGTSVEVLKAILKQMNSSETIDDVKLRSWAKSYAVAQKVPNAIVFSTTRTASRENLFKWVGPIASAQIGIIALKEKKIKINSIKDLENYRIGAVLKDIGELQLLDVGVPKDKIQHVKGEDAINLSFKKMEKNRIDMFTYDTNVAFANAKQEGFDISKYEVVYKFKGGNKYYFAFNKETDDTIIQKWQKALDEIRKNGIIK